jgi:hypothetical protein
MNFSHVDQLDQLSISSDSPSMVEDLVMQAILDTPYEPSTLTIGQGKKGKREPLSNWWKFTWNNYHKTTDWTEEMQAVYDAALWFVAQEEVGENGTPHLQGAVQFPSRVRPNEKGFLRSADLQDWDEATQGPKPVPWWQPLHPTRKTKAKKGKGGRASAKDYLDAFWYCLKDDTRKEGGRRWHKGCPRPLQRVSKAELRPWQKRIFESVEQPCERDDRKIRWYWEETGNIGKTFLVKAMFDSGLNVICVGGQAKDAIYAIGAKIQAEECGPDVIIFDIPRCCESNVSYRAMEELKNGIAFQSKYESQSLRFNTPHVLVFSNGPPPEPERLSEDRWVIKELVGLETL